MVRGYRRRPTCVKWLPCDVPKLGFHDRRPGLAPPEQEWRAALRAEVPEPLTRPGTVRLERGRVQPPVPGVARRRMQLLPEPGRREEVEWPPELELEAQTRVGHPIAALREVGQIAEHGATLPVRRDHREV